MYDLKYRSNFYNIFGKLVEVKIYKKDYGEHDVILLRSTEVTLEVNWQDENTFVIGTGLRVVIVNEGDFTSLDDLLRSQEKQFECIVVYDNDIVFDGFSLCDLNEQQFVPWAKITLQFTDYLRRLDGSFAPCLSAVGGASDILTLLQDAFQQVGLTRSLHVNSSLFETRMLNSVVDTFLEQTFLDNIMFFMDANTYDNTYDALNKALRSFNAYLYSFGDKWVLERYDDITRSPVTQTWVSFANLLDSAEPSGTADANLRQWYNKQAGDFKYTELSQVIEYDSGLQKLILQLKDKQLDTFVFNDYKKSTMLTTTDQFPYYTALDLKKWYIYSTNTVIRNGLIWRSMTNYIEFLCDTGHDFEFDGLYYHFKLTFNTPLNYVNNPDTDPETPTELSINFKQAAGHLDLSVMKTITTRFCIMLGGWFLAEFIDEAGATFWGTTATPTAIRNDFDVSTTGNKDSVSSVSETINLTDPIAMTAIPGGDVIFMSSIWDFLGRPATIDCVIMFFPEVVFGKGDPSIRTECADNYIGDIQIGVASQKVANKLTYYINADFVKTESLDMDFFDLINDNFANGPSMIGDSAGEERIKTEKWSTLSHPISAPLMDIFARVKFGNYCHTLHKLKGTIISDNYLKPFSILTDDNLKDDSGNNIELILRGYTWNLNEGTYEIGEAIEFTEEVLGITETPSGGDESSAGSPVIEFYAEIAPSTLDWAYNSTAVKTFMVTTNMPRWYIASASSYEGWTVTVWDVTNTTQIINGIFTSEMIVRVTPLANNTGTTNKYAYISVANESDEIMIGCTMIGTQIYQGADDPPIVSPMVGDSSFTLAQFDHVLATASTNLWLQWTPADCALTDWTMYIYVTRGGNPVGSAQYPHNDNGVMRSMWLPINEAAVAGATYSVNFLSSLV